MGTGIGGRGVIQFPLGWRLLERRGRKFARSVGFALRRIGSKGLLLLLLFRLGSIARERFATDHAGCGGRQEGSVDDGGGGEASCGPLVFKVWRGLQCSRQKEGREMWLGPGSCRLATCQIGE